jgi:hypothetical protein
MLVSPAPHARGVSLCRGRCHGMTRRGVDATGPPRLARRHFDRKEDLPHAEFRGDGQQSEETAGEPPPIHQDRGRRRRPHGGSRGSSGRAGLPPLPRARSCAGCGGWIHRHVRQERPGNEGGRRGGLGGGRAQEDLRGLTRHDGRAHRGQIGPRGRPGGGAGPPRAGATKGPRMPEQRAADTPTVASVAHRTGSGIALPTGPARGRGPGTPRSFGRPRTAPRARSPADPPTTG